ncbi:unnamed protein product [Cuscuta epithymum]|uniref:Uncharacterized protein n=1 Tax=Cuscuta epithymum TaxID=186058 RepID=A0AAV0F042_9ASTE|nr:unnamed protein product [Cuscuta epithymum]
MSLTLDAASWLRDSIAGLLHGNKWIYSRHNRLLSINLASNNFGEFLRISQTKGRLLIIPTGNNFSGLSAFFNMLDNTLSSSGRFDPDPLTTYEEQSSSVDISISKLLIQADLENPKEQKLEECDIFSGNHKIIAFSEHSDRYFSGDKFIGHASESDKRPPNVLVEDLWDADTNTNICKKALLITQDNCLPTDNLNTQIKIYQKRKKNRRLHSMTTRSQSRGFGIHWEEEDWSGSEYY